MSNDRTTLGERYAIAISSNHLELSLRRQGSIDLIIAAGFSDRMGSMLMRLMAEYASAKGPYISARRHLAASMIVVKNIQSRAEHIPKTSAAYLSAVNMANDLESDAIQAAKISYAHILLKLPSLSPAKEAFCNWAMAQAHRMRFMEPGDQPETLAPTLNAWKAATQSRIKVVNALAGRVLDMLLEPTCAVCDGRGFFGGYSNNPQTPCVPNKRTGIVCNGERRLEDIGRTEEEKNFAFALMELAKRTIRKAESEMNEKLQGKQ